VRRGRAASSYLYRKVLPELAARGLRGVAFDYPGLGFADRPESFDYSWTGLGRWSLEAIDALGLDRYHVIVHDIGGPAGLEVVAAAPERVLSLTILNSPVCVSTFVKPWVMRPFEKPVLGELWLASMLPPLFVQLMYLIGVQDRAGVPAAELVPYVRLLKREDGGKAFLKIMRSFEPTPEKETRYVGAIQRLKVPVQFVWGDRDPALKLDVHGLPAQRATGVKTFHRVPAKHFLQEDRAPAIAAHVATLVG